MSEKQIKRMQTEYKGVEKTFIESNAVIKEFTYALDDFSEKSNPQNASEHRSYVYALCERIGESLIPFYIGEGKGPRVWSHELEASDQMRLQRKLMVGLLQLVVHRLLIIQILKRMVGIMFTEEQ